MQISVIGILLLIGISISEASTKTVYIPLSKRNSMDLNKSSSKFCYARSRESENIAVFWESEFGSDPSTAAGDYRVNMTTLLNDAENAYSMYLDTLKFAIKGSSVTDSYKLVIFLLDTAAWTANGAGEDEVVGSLQVNYAAAKIGNVVAHEIGHCFQYITGCDTDGGYRYGLGENGAGGNGFWEQCAQWMAWNVYPGKQFTENDFRVYLANHHKHILHEIPRYANFFIQEYWTYKHDITFLGRLWRDSRKPEDPVETYMRLNSLTQAQFNDELFEQAARLTTWDLPGIKQYGEKYIDSRTQPKMSLTSDKHWLIDTSACPENYGYNCIKLNVPSPVTDVTVQFKGKAGTGGFRALKTNKSGWRFGFVALLKDGTRKYSAMGTANYASGANPDISLTFNCPANCSKLWLVVSGAPQEHWKHTWDDSTYNDEQWPYQVQFGNTNLLGQITGTIASFSKAAPVHVIPTIKNNTVYLPEFSPWHIANLAGRELAFGFGNSVDITTLPAGRFILSYGGRHLKVLKR